MSVSRLPGSFRLFCLVLASCALLTASGVQAITLAKWGESSYSIVIPDRAIAAEKTAASELRDGLKQVTGVDFAISPESQVSADSPQILVGQSRRAKKLLPDVDWKSLGMDGIVLRTVGDNLVLSGGRPRGSLYAVYSFLEDTVGCRWWTSTESFIPRRATLDVPALSTVYVPKLRYREAFYRDPLENPAFAARMKLNGNFYRIPPAYGGHYEVLGWCHTSFALLPPDKYFAKHPDWYGEINGKRTPDWSQLCFSNEEMRKELTRTALERIKKNPAAGIISISQNDWIGNCQCAKCKAIDAEEGSPSGSLIRGVNAVAEEIEKRYPDVLVETLAYQYSRKAPLHVRPRKNVVVRLCSIECNYVAPLDSDGNSTFRDDIKQWSAIAPNLYIWNYVTDFANYVIPFPNMRGLAPDLRLFVKNNAIGVFEQGDSATTIGDFVRLRNWVISHLMWNPDLDQSKLVSEFLRGYYGPAAPYLQRYLDLIHDAAAKKGMYLSCYNGDLSFLTFDDMSEATRLFERASDAVKGDRALSARVRRDRMPLDLMWLLRYEELKATAGKHGVPFPGPTDGRAACDEFIKMARDWDAKNISEGMLFEAYVPGLKTMFAPPPPKPEEFARIPKDDVVEIQQDEFSLANPGVWVSLVDDPKASDGKAARMGGDHTAWAVQFHVTDDFARSHPGQWNCYIIARAEGASDGQAFRYGMYYEPAHREGAAITAWMNTASDGAYHAFYAGSHELKKGCYLWVAPCANPDVVKGVYVDRVVFVKDRGE